MQEICIFLHCVCVCVCVCVCFLWCAQWAASIFVNSVNLLVFVLETEYSWRCELNLCSLYALHECGTRTRMYKLTKCPFPAVGAIQPAPIHWIVFSHFRRSDHCLPLKKSKPKYHKVVPCPTPIRLVYTSTYPGVDVALFDDYTALFSWDA